jgi:hypothetical protein
MPVPDLTPAQIERLALLIEECGEVQQIMGKILRHGYESFHPNDPATTNRELLAKELGHVNYAAVLMADNNDFNSDLLHQSLSDKRITVEQWLHYQGVGG